MSRKLTPLEVKLCWIPNRRFLYGIRFLKLVLGFVAGLVIFNNVSAQSCEDAIVTTSPDVRYLNNGDGTITDQHHGLMWKRCNEGKGGSNCELFTGTLTYTWQEAMQLAETINTSGGFAGHADWRLPNLKELASLVEEQCSTPALNETFFPGAQFNPSSAAYWSSSPSNPHAQFTNNAGWLLDFKFGNNIRVTREFKAYVRFVRGG